MTIRRGVFKAQDLLKLPTPPLDSVLTSLLSHIVRCAGNVEKLSLIREAVMEVIKFIDETIREERDADRIN